jgi:hypothetical protein
MIKSLQINILSKYFADKIIISNFAAENAGILFLAKTKNYVGDNK